MINFITQNGLIQFEDAATTARILESEQRVRLAAEAEQVALSTVYRVAGEADPTRLFGGLLTNRLDISERSAYELLRTGKLRFATLGKKNIRVTEKAIREYLDDIKRS